MGIIYGNKIAGTFDWTDAVIETLKGLWTSGWSATEIAAKLDGPTRSAVLGKVHRLGLEKRRDATIFVPRDPSTPRKSPPPRPARYAPPVKIAPPPAPAPLECRPCSLHELSSTRCKWPIGHPGEKNFHFCGASPKADKPYCRFHCGIAYQPPPTRVRRPFIPTRGISA
jgi:GcrA cell cycle regulator